MTKLSPHFRRSEFECNCGQCSGYDTVDAELLNMLEAIRTHFNKPVRITSGHRCPTHNANVGGTMKSQHLFGRAADIQVQDTSPQEVYDFAETLEPGGLGLYDDFVHIDSRNGKARW